MNQNAYCTMENGKTKIDEARIYQLANILDMPLNALMTGNGEDAIHKTFGGDSTDIHLSDVNSRELTMQLTH